MITLAVAQTNPSRGDVATNLVRIESTIRTLHEATDLVVFPELFTTGYDLEGLDLAAVAEEIPGGPTSRRLALAAAQSRIAVVGSIVERTGDALFDTAVVFDRHGALAGRYRKSHLYPAEREHFAPGSELGLVDLDGFRLGLAICFEHAFPEIFAELALAGAQVIAIPSAVPAGFEYLIGLRSRARAQDNQVFVAAANLAGDDGRTRWCGRSMIVDPRGAVLAEAGEHVDAVIRAEVDLGMIERERQQEPIWANRRPELYSALHRRPVPLPVADR